MEHHAGGVSASNASVRGGRLRRQLISGPISQREYSCSHYCEQKGAKIPNREQLAKADFRDLIDRSKYMERILKRTIKGIRLDSKSLAELADSLDADGDNASLVGSDAQEVEGLVMDDEACTMDPREDNTTRQYPQFDSIRIYLIADISRLFRRIFILELLHAAERAF